MLILYEVGVVFSEVILFQMWIFFARTKLINNIAKRVEAKLKIQIASRKLTKPQKSHQNSQLSCRFIIFVWNSSNNPIRKWWIYMTIVNYHFRMKFVKQSDSKFFFRSQNKIFDFELGMSQAQANAQIDDKMTAWYRLLTSVQLRANGRRKKLTKPSKSLRNSWFSLRFQSKLIIFLQNKCFRSLQFTVGRCHVCAATGGAFGFCHHLFRFVRRATSFWKQQFVDRKYDCNSHGHFGVAQENQVEEKKFGEQNAKSAPRNLKFDFDV